MPGPGPRPRGGSVNPKLVAVLIVALFFLLFGRQFFHQVPAGHVGIATFFGEVEEDSYPEGPHFPVNPLLAWYDMDVREKTTMLKGVEVPTRDQLLTKIDISLQYRLDASKAPKIYRETGDETMVVAVHLIPKARSLLREMGSRVDRAEDFFQEETRDLLAVGLTEGLSAYVGEKGILIDTVLVRSINLPTVLANAIEQKKEREQAVERQKAELERFRTEQLQQVAAAEAARLASEEQSKRQRILADAKAYEISAINKAIRGNPAYVQLQALEALKEMAKDPAAKIYFMDSNSTQPLPLMHMGELK
ncbi:MAG: prohibitin family protein [Deltaproteobacteria bacterium]|nr:prohibitin family protein [Deltaproteobacteria bacterium]